MQVYSVISTNPKNEARFKEAISNDSTLQKVKYYALNGWPSHKANVPSSVKPFWSLKNEIFLHKDVLFYGKRLIIPLVLREEFLNLIHQAHQGVVSCKKVAQESIFWPGICQDIEKFVLNCMTCQEYSASNAREPLTSHTPPELPWKKIGIDFKALGQLNFIVAVDYYSKFTIVNKLKNKTAETVISSLKNIFAINGIPQEIFSDNGPPFNSEEFENFAKKYDIKFKSDVSTF